MGIRYMTKEREDNLVQIHVEGHGCVDGIFNCYGRFNNSHAFSDGFKPDGGWYRISDYTIDDLKKFKLRNVVITCSDTCKEVKEAIFNVSES